MKYRINPGHSFLDSDGSTKTGGDTIDLSDDVAQQHRDKVTALSEAISATDPSDGSDGSAADTTTGAPLEA